MIGILRILAIPASALEGFLYELSPSAPFLLYAISGLLCSLIVALLVEEPRRKEV